MLMPVEEGWTLRSWRKAGTGAKLPTAGEGQGGPGARLCSSQFTQHPSPSLPSGPTPSNREHPMPLQSGPPSSTPG